MLDLEEEAQKNKPKRPTPVLFSYRTDHLTDLPEGQRSAANAKQLWEKEDQAVKDKYEE